LAGEDFLAGLDRVRADAAGQQLTPVPGLSSTTAAGLARQITPGQWEAIETGVTAVTERVLTLLPPERASQLADGPVTIDLDAIDVEVYGRQKRGAAYDYQGQHVGCPHVAAWAETEIVLATDLGSGTDDPQSNGSGPGGGGSLLTIVLRAGRSTFSPAGGFARARCAPRGRLAGGRQVRGAASRSGSRRHWPRDQCPV
jgi:hypothetical protein